MDCDFFFLFRDLTADDKQELKNFLFKNSFMLADVKFRRALWEYSNEFHEEDFYFAENLRDFVRDAEQEPSVIFEVDDR